MSTYNLSDLKSEYPNGIFFNFLPKLGFKDNTQISNFLITNWNNWNHKHCTDVRLDKLIESIIFAYQILIKTNFNQYDKIGMNTFFIRDMLFSIFIIQDEKKSLKNKEFYFNKYPQLKMYVEGKYFETK